MGGLGVVLLCFSAHAEFPGGGHPSVDGRDGEPFEGGSHESVTVDEDGGGRGAELFGEVEESDEDAGGDGYESDVLVRGQFDVDGFESFGVGLEEVAGDGGDEVDHGAHGHLPGGLLLLPEVGDVRVHGDEGFGAWVDGWHDGSVVEVGSFELYGLASLDAWSCHGPTVTVGANGRQAFSVPIESQSATVATWRA